MIWIYKEEYEVGVNAQYSQLKFKPPYRDIVEFNTYEYLAGDIYFQVFKRPGSVEMRMIL